MNVRFTPLARAEFRQAVDYYEQQQKGLGRAFASDVAHAVGQIRDHPRGWTAISKYPRRFRIHRFPYGVLYCIEAELVVIVGVVDLRRSPGAWTQRRGG